MEVPLQKQSNLFNEKIKIRSGGQSIGYANGNGTRIDSPASRNCLAYFPMTTKVMMAQKRNPTRPQSSFCVKMSPADANRDPIATNVGTQFASFPRRDDE